MNYAATIKEMISARQVFSFYGFQINTSGFCKSPFVANDKTPSLKVYDGDRGWHDFSSGNGGDVLDFVMQYFGLSFLDAQRKINDDFRLGLPIDKPQSRQEQIDAANRARKQREAIQERERKEQALRDAVDRALSAFVILDKLLMRQRPTERILAQYDAAWYNYCEASYNLSSFLSQKG